ncbi:MAG: SPOR domain-containing protein [Bradyrhizobium sp.]|nr:SPOR domain-containing protein [Bradyrhizobium sp.]
MADRYPNRSFPADDYGRGSDQHGSGGGESDPLAELARLIGQTDPFGTTTRQPPPPPPRAAIPREPHQPQYQAPIEEEDDSSAPAGPPPWMQRANIQRHAVRGEPPRAPAAEYSEDDAWDDHHPDPVHPLHRYAAQPAAPFGDQAEEQVDPSRYDDALYGQLESGAQDFQREPAYPDDPYAYQDGYEEESEERPKRRGGLLTVAAVLALAVVGTGAAFAYRTYVGSPRTGEPPVIKADNTPTKIIPAQSDTGKTPDRLPAGDGTEKLVPREEAPVDVNARTAGPRVVFPPLNANVNPPTAASVATNNVPPAAPGAAANNGTMPNSEPRKIKTFSVHGEEADASAVSATSQVATSAPSAKPAAAARQVPSSAARAAANAPLSLSPDSALDSVPPPEPRTRIASTAPAQIAPSSDSGSAGEGRFLVQVSSQKTESDAQASYRALQRKFPDALGSHTPVIKRADLGDKGTVYRAMVGPFASREEAARFCINYKSAGGQCFVP